MAEAKQKAIDLDDTKRTGVEFELGGEVLEIRPKGATGGKEFVLVSDDLRFEFASPKKEWAVVWRATAAGLWEHGLEKIRERAHACLKKAGFTPKRPDQDWCKLSRVDYCFDIWSPEFTKEMSPELANTLVAPSEVKWRADMWGKGHHADQGRARAQTLTFGAKGGCQVQIYDKTAEIIEASGKDWMLEIWGEHGGYYPPGKPEDVWRVEVRMAGDWLKDRTDKDPEKFLEHMWQLIADALFNRRMTVPQPGDSNRRRWPLHPLYTLIIHEIGNPREFLQVGRRVTMRRDELAEIMLRGVAGTVRSCAVLMFSGAFDEERARGLLDESLTRMFNDAEHRRKIERAMERYQFVDEAR